MEREPTLTQSLAGFVADLRREEVPEPVMEDAVRRVVDAVGVGLAGSTSPYASMALEVAGEYRRRPEATAFGSGRQLPAPLAAMVNAALVHGHDFDDMHSRAMVHISCVTVPAAIALAEQRGATGADCLLALVRAPRSACGLATPPLTGSSSAAGTGRRSAARSRRRR